MKKSVIITLLSLVGIAHFALAQEAAVYRDSILSIPSGVIIDETGVTAIRDVTLVEESDGRFRVVEAGEGRLADVDAVAVSSTDETDVRVKVTVEGYQSSACVDILKPAIVRDGKVFTAVLSESAQWSDACIMMMKRYETSFHLDVRDLAEGDYVVTVNGVETQFTL